MRKLLNWVVMTLVAGGGVAAAITGTASAATVCSERPMCLSHRAADYRENPVAMGLAANGKMLEILVSRSGSWTILITSPDGRSCVVAVGENWEQFKDTTTEPVA